MNNKKGLLLLVSVFAVLLSIGVLMYYIYGNKGNNVNMSDVTTEIKEATFDGSDEYNITLEKSMTITKEGIYYLTGTLDGEITINTDGDVKLVLESVSIKNSNGAAINVENANIVYIQVEGNNTINATISDEEIDGAIYSVSDLVLTGSGTLNITSNSNGIKTKGNMLIESGTYNITSDGDSIHVNDSLKINGGTFNIDSNDDGLRANDVLEINDGNITIDAVEGIEANYVKINGGTIKNSASDDGINATDKSTNYTPTIEINGGNITIDMEEGDTDGLDANGYLYINGGTLTINGQSPFDYDIDAKYTGGKMIINGEETTTITNQFAGGMGGNMGGQQVMPPNESNNKGGHMTPPELNGDNMTPPNMNEENKNQNIKKNGDTTESKKNEKSKN